MLVNLSRDEVNLILTWATFYVSPNEDDVDLMDKLEEMLGEFDEDED